MPLLRKITKDQFSELDAAVQAFYLPEGDEYLLDADFSDIKGKLNEFRENNIKLAKKRDKLEADLEKYNGIDPEKARNAAVKLQDLEDQHLIDEGKMDELLEQRTQRMQDSFDNKYTALEEVNTSLKTNLSATTQELSKVLIASEIMAAVSEVGTLRKGAMPDVVARAQGVWKLDENRQLIPMDGENIRYGTDGKTQLSKAEWASDLVQTAPFLFEGSKGTGADGNDNANLDLNGGRIDASDKQGFSDNIDKIAAGEVRVG